MQNDPNKLLVNPNTEEGKQGLNSEETKNDNADEPKNSNAEETISEPEKKVENAAAGSDYLAQMVANAYFSKPIMDGVKGVDATNKH